MLVSNSFDLWRKDTFFGAAEEVQKSADIMESAYRTWLRAKREGLVTHNMDEINRDLQMALGTAKWQLEEFEKAVRSSYKKNGDDITIVRHRQFVSTLEHQISNVELALKESFNVEGKKSFRWVDLDEGENDDFALFLSGIPYTSKVTKDESIEHKADAISSKMQIPFQGNIFEVVTSSKSPENGDLEVVIDCYDGQKNASIQEYSIEKDSKSLFFNSRVEDHTGAKRAAVLTRLRLKIMNWINQHSRGVHRSQRQQSPVLMANPIRFVLAMMLTVFLVVPFLVYSA